MTRAQQAAQVLASDPGRTWSVGAVLALWVGGPRTADGVRMSLRQAVCDGLAHRPAPGMYKAGPGASAADGGRQARPVAPGDAPVWPYLGPGCDINTKLVTEANDWTKARQAVQAAWEQTCPGMPPEEFTRMLHRQPTLVLYAGKQPCGLLSYRAADDGWLVTCCWSCDHPGGRGWRLLWLRLLKGDLAQFDDDMVHVRGCAGGPLLEKLGFTSAQDGEWAAAVCDTTPEKYLADSL